VAFAILEGESIFQAKLQFALLLRDGFADSDQLLGDVVVTGGTIRGQQKDSSGTFLFYGLNPGSQSLSVSSGQDTPYYLPTNVAITIPVPPPPPPVPTFLWPAFPDIRLADPNLPLRDPGQKPAYITQRQASTLLPSTGYPFPEGTTLIRGIIRHGAQPLTGAVVQRVGGSDPAYTTDKDGQFVLYWKDAPGIPKAVTVNAKFGGRPDANTSVTVMRGLTASLTIDM
jgi:hypothetical protein